MARLISWPVGLRVGNSEPLSGPRAVGSGATGSIANFNQTFSSPFGLWRWRFSFPSMNGQMFRRYRGWITALHGGANATRVPFCDPDGLTLAQLGVDASPAEWQAGQPWSNGQSWANGQNWQSSPPSVSIASAASQGGTIVHLGSEFWGLQLGVGDFLGFFPLHLGLYMVTEVIGSGRYRIWPPLRKELTIADSATVRPTMAMKLESEESANAPRGVAFAEGLTATLVEVLDYDVKAYFAG
ncbi:hypothetical protein [Aminobacter aminovorans]|uniref:hypothetical protein n=1 Tax=Aminobacter aminovorans TaxID=83263 RepID=UPI002856B0AF|nr:hypothetical protein [Aminobacter aminovorans]MDR7220360.1 hypothetical protein [Aminobacter aminovorans]